MTTSLSGISDASLRAAWLQVLHGRRNASVILLEDVLYQVIRRTHPRLVEPEIGTYFRSILTGWSMQSKNEVTPDVVRMTGAFWGLVTEGLICPRFHLRSGGNNLADVEALILTGRAKRLLESMDGHPLHDKFTERLQKEGVNESVIARVVDAGECLRAGLLRAAVVMVGLAFEETLELCVMEPRVKSLFGNKKVPTIARERLKLLTDSYTDIADPDDATKSLSDEWRHKLSLALLAAEEVRVERNNASHPGRRFEDAELVEALIGCTRNIGILWRGFGIPAGKSLPE